MSGDSVNGSTQGASGRGISHQTSLPPEELIHAIGDVGQTVDRLQISVERQIRELTEYVNQCEKNHQTDMAHWRTVTENLAQLLQVKTQATQEVSGSYMRLAEYLAKFNNYLMMSETTLSRVEPPLLSLLKALPSLSDGTMPLQIAEGAEMSPRLSQALSEAKTTHGQIRAELKQTLLRIQQSAIPSGQSKKETSIWTELAVWRAALVWVGVGAVAASVLHWGVFRSGFWLALREIRSQGATIEEVRDRLERLEVWIGIPGDAETTD
ncbi:hypothetical protein C7271_01475 [filamentous cyanobacterium CCP5]|nr:hypothetical protein C7271_01475 [filamentous cyanobacterium CCP5]